MKRILTLLFFLPFFAGAQTNIFTTQTPDPNLKNDGKAITLGVLFQSSVAGNITGIRFYKVSGNTGTHTALLYSSNGTLLASATFSGETSSGWQSVTFSQPIGINANTTYIAAYWSGSGNYNRTLSYFGTSTINSPLTALAETATQANGVYIYSSAPAFPVNDNGNKTNYWVDVTFTGGSAVANAGADWSIVSPASSGTLDGSASTGANSYLWTKVSGPNTPTIVNPTNSITSVTGLIQGNYIFQLSINGGVSTDQVNVSVLPSANFTFTIIDTSQQLNRQDGGIEQWQHFAFDNLHGVDIYGGGQLPYNYYRRFAWKEIESDVTQGSYSWTLFDQAVHQAIDAGEVFSFGVMPLCVGCSIGQIPTYVHNLMQTESTTDWFDATDGYWIPNWNSANYFARYKALMQAVADHIKNTSYKGITYSNIIYQVDIRGYGNYGEWHASPWDAYGTTPAATKPTQATLDSLISMNLQIFPDYQAMILVGAYSDRASSYMPYQTSYYALTAKNNIGEIGWRRDNWGDPGTDIILKNNSGSYNPGDSVHHFNYMILKKYKKGPVAGEPLSNDATVSASCGTPYCDLLRQGTDYHAGTIGNGNYQNGAGSAGLQNNIKNVNRYIGHRLHPSASGGGMTTTLVAGQTFNVTIPWNNDGLAPTYYNWTTTFELRNPNGTVAATFTSSFTPKLFLPTTSAVTFSDNFFLPSNILPTSGYSLYMKIIDPFGYKVPLVLAITGRQSDGAYLLRSGITVTTGSQLCSNCLLHRPLYDHKKPG